MDDAIQRFKAIVETSPKDELARFSLGNTYWGAGRYREARDQLKVALSLKPDWMAVAILLGKCHMELGEKKEAREVFQRALELAVCQCHEGPKEELQDLLKELD